MKSKARIGARLRIGGSNRPVVLVLALFSLALVAATASVEARLNRQEIGNNLSQAEQAFRRAMELDRSDPEAARAYYSEAVLNFERIIKDGGVRNGSLYYNIGNAYFRLGDVGRAILNYKRASLYMANDPNLRQNIDHARNRRADRIERRQQEKVYRTLFFLHYDIPSRVKLIMFAACFAVVWLAAGMRLFVRVGGIKVVLIIAAIVSGVFLASLGVDAVSFSSRPAGVITVEEVMGRMGDAETYQPSFKEPLHSGTEFKLLEKRAGWWRIELENGDETWIPNGTAELAF